MSIWDCTSKTRKELITMSSNLSFADIETVIEKATLTHHKHRVLFETSATRLNQLMRGSQANRLSMYDVRIEMFELALVNYRSERVELISRRDHQIGAGKILSAGVHELRITRLKKRIAKTSAAIATCQQKKSQLDASTQQQIVEAMRVKNKHRISYRESGALLGQLKRKYYRIQRSVS